MPMPKNWGAERRNYWRAEAALALLFGFDLHQFGSSSGVGVNCQHVADPRCMKLAFEKVGFQWGRFL